MLYGVRPATESRVTRHERTRQWELWESAKVSVFHLPTKLHHHLCHTTAPIGEVQVAIARFLPHLQHMAYFVERVLATVHALIQQLAALSKPPSSGGIKKLGQLGGPLHHRSTIGTLARALSLLIRVDSILRNNAILQEHWVAFKRMFDDEQSDSTKAAVDVQLSPGDCVTMRNVIMRTDTLLFGGGGGSLAVFDVGDLCDARAACVVECGNDRWTFLLQLATRNAVDDQATRGVAVQESPQLADHIKIWLNKELAQISKSMLMHKQWLFLINNIPASQTFTDWANVCMATRFLS